MSNTEPIDIFASELKLKFDKFNYRQLRDLAHGLTLIYSLSDQFVKLARYLDICLKHKLQARLRDRVPSKVSNLLY